MAALASVAPAAGYGIETILGATLGASRSRGIPLLVNVCEAIGICGEILVEVLNRVARLQGKSLPQSGLVFKG